MTTLIGRQPDSLTIGEQRALSGRWVALEIYTPDNLALRRIAAVGDSAQDCLREIVSKGGNPRDFEYRTYKAAGL